RRLPAAVSSLAGVVREGGIQLTWSIPQRRVDGSRLIDPGLTRVFRVEDAGEGEPRAALLVDDRVAGYTEIATIRLAEPPSPLVQGSRVSYVDRRGLTPDRRYTYVVVTTDAQGRTSPPSRRLSVRFVATPLAPAGLRAEPGDREVRLSWQPPARLSDGSAVSGPLAYEVLRAPAADAPLAVVTRTAPGVTTAVDRGLENDHTYHYAVRALRQEGETLAEGEPTASVAVTPLDVTPPSPPGNLVAIPSEGTVRLSWTPSPEPDVAGYVVYRAAADGVFVRVGGVRVPGTTFTDRDVPAGTYRYAVTAQDASARANESRRSAEASVTVP
ncbi:MAG TPA: fibronectin type III domain-containing protein, partial [Methylomirabilota bacterium]|nr:fibronectin type III domain-containing protein [Methylomirabilota bacterium]